MLLPSSTMLLPSSTMLLPFPSTMLLPFLSTILLLLTNINITVQTRDKIVRGLELVFVLPLDLQLGLLNVVDEFRLVLEGGMYILHLFTPPPFPGPRGGGNIIFKIWGENMMEGEKKKGKKG